MPENKTYSFGTIGIVRSCFKEKFGIPRQAGLVSRARARLEIFSPYDREEAFRGIEEFSHLWILFVFHAARRGDRKTGNTWKSTVRPPRLGGNQRIGVFASRSGFRPNPIGISAVKLEKTERIRKTLTLYLKGGDFLDGTPVLDIKPYLPYADSIPAAQGGFAPVPPETFAVDFSPGALEICIRKEKEIRHLRDFIVEMLQTDPRPAYYSRKSGKKIFASRVYDMDIRWEAEQNRIRVSEIRELQNEGVSFV